MGRLGAQQHHVIVGARLWIGMVQGHLTFDRLPLVTRIWVANVALLLIVLRFTVVDLVRQVIGAPAAEVLERRISAWLREREAR